MATLKTIRKRITSVKNTQKITKAMKMVAAAKLRRAQTALSQAKPHSQRLQESVERLVKAQEAWNHPLLKAAEAPKKAALLVLTSDRGLCGGFNGNLLRKVDSWTRHEGKIYEEIQLSTLGRKGRDYYRAKNIETKESLSSFGEEFSFSKAEAVAAEWLARLQNHEFDVMYLAYNSFKSAISQEPIIRQVLPLHVPQDESAPSAEVVWEGSSEEILNALLTRLMATQFFIAILESNASELGSRMSAMENATKNASEMIQLLTLQYNRARQAAITTELMDIVNGAEALK